MDASAYIRRRIEFGRVTLDPDQTRQLAWMNRQLIQVCRSLPRALQSPAVLFLQTQYAAGSLHGLIDFFRLYHPPAWTLLVWLARNAPLPGETLEIALRGQAMAMLLHMLDDHLADGEVKPAHHVLQLRTVAWQTYEASALELAGPRASVYHDFIDQYFTGVQAPPTCSNLEDYCNIFRSEMATWKALPILMALQTGYDDASCRQLLQAYESFGVAWRLLDDIRDAGADAAAAQRSAVYWSLDLEARAAWDAGRPPGSAELNRAAGFLASLLDEHLLRAASHARALDLAGYARELEELRPEPGDDHGSS